MFILHILKLLIALVFSTHNSYNILPNLNHSTITTTLYPQGKKKKKGKLRGIELQKE